MKPINELRAIGDLFSYVGDELRGISSVPGPWADTSRRLAELMSSASARLRAVARGLDLPEPGTPAGEARIDATLSATLRGRAREMVQEISAEAIREVFRQRLNKWLDGHMWSMDSILDAVSPPIGAEEMWQACDRLASERDEKARRRVDPGNLAHLTSAMFGSCCQCCCAPAPEPGCGCTCHGPTGVSSSGSD